MGCAGSCFADRSVGAHVTPLGRRSIHTSMDSSTKLPLDVDPATPKIERPNRVVSGIPEEPPKTLTHGSKGE